jgi:hypothetical protein
MGEIPGDDFIKGFYCAHCFPTGAPKYIQITVSGVLQCVGYPWDPNGIYLLQNIAACQWRYQSGNVRVSLWLNSFFEGAWHSSIIVENFLYDGQFFASLEAPCCYTHNNRWVEAQCGLGAAGYGGIAICNWGPGIDP